MFIFVPWSFQGFCARSLFKNTGLKTKLSSLDDCLQMIETRKVEKSKITQFISFFFNVCYVVSAKVNGRHENIDSHYFRHLVFL